MVNDVAGIRSQRRALHSLVKEPAVGTDRTFCWGEAFLSSVRGGYAKGEPKEMSMVITGRAHEKNADLVVRTKRDGLERHSGKKKWQHLVR